MALPCLPLPPALGLTLTSLLPFGPKLTGDGRARPCGGPEGAPAARQFQRQRVWQLLLPTPRVTAPPDLGKARSGEGQKARQECGSCPRLCLPAGEPRGAWPAPGWGRRQLTLPRHCSAADGKGLRFSENQRALVREATWGQEAPCHGQWHRSWVRATKLDAPLTGGHGHGKSGTRSWVATGRAPSGRSRAPLKRGSMMGVPRGGRLLPLGGHWGGNVVAPDL